MMEVFPTPWIVKWPAKIKLGQKTTSLVSSVDIAPSFLEITGLKSLESFEGTSFLPILKDARKITREYAFSEDRGHDFEDHGRAVANQHWKLIHNTYPDLPNTPSADAGRSPTWIAIQRLRKEINSLLPNVVVSANLVLPRKRCLGPMGLINSAKILALKSGSAIKEILGHNFF
jgi:hypothetical protein